MRLLRVHAPGTDSVLAGRISEAVAEFNRALDIRLRFLSIVIEDAVLDLAEHAEGPCADGAAQVGAALSDRPADVVLLLGNGSCAVAAANAVSERGAFLVRVGAGERNGKLADANRAVDALARAHLHFGADAAASLDADAIEGLRVDVGGAADTEIGDRIVRAIGRVRRRAQGGR